MRAMKNSGIEWIKYIPRDWNTSRGKNVLSLMKRPPSDKVGVITCFRDGEVTLRNNRRQEGFTFSDKEIGYQGIDEGDLVIHGMDGFAGAIGISDSSGKGSPVLVVCKPKYDNNTRYLMYYLRLLAEQNVFLALATGIRERSCDLRWNKIAELIFPIPKTNEQTRISSFLDKKCAAIDSAIEKQRASIDKLKEYRQAVITEAVTKGLNPDVPMKDSGVEWIGEIPEGWDIVPLTKQLESIVDYRGKTPHKVDEGVFLITAKNIKSGKIDYDLSKEYVPESEYEKIMHRGKPMIGDVLFTTEAPLGEVANIDNVDIALAQRIIKFRPINAKLSGYFLKYWIMSTYFQNILQSLSTGSTAVGIKSSKLFMLPLTLCSLSEQTEIAAYLDEKCSAIDETVSGKEKLIEKLEEYKKSLIYEAVTGKIEVPT